MAEGPWSADVFHWPSLHFLTQILACFSIAFIVSLSHLMSDQPSIISTVGEGSLMALLVHQGCFNFFAMSFVLSQGGDESSCKPGDCPQAPCTTLLAQRCSDQSTLGISPDRDAPLLNDTLYSLAVLALVALFQVRGSHTQDHEKRALSGCTARGLSHHALSSVAGWLVLLVRRRPALHAQAAGHRHRQLARAAPPVLAPVVSLALAKDICRLLADPLCAGSRGAVPPDKLR